MSTEPLISQDLLGKLERLDVAFRRAQRGRPEGERSGTRHGGRIEFADYREYSPGDDFRHIDWNVLSRTGDLVVKQFQREEQYLIAFMLDASGSMGFPRDSSDPSKLEYGAACLAALAYVGLAAGHRIETGFFADDRCDWTPSAAGRSAVFGLIDRLAKLKPAGGTAIASALEQAAERWREPCLLVVISDLLDTERWQAPLASLTARGYDASLIQVLSRDEVEPQPSGRVRLRDAETGEALSLRVTRQAAAAYSAALRELGERQAEFCRRHGIRLVSTTTDVPFEDFVMRYLLREGLVR
jgi:uncharacterized protein (DUF58 family)